MRYIPLTSALLNKGQELLVVIRVFVINHGYQRSTYGVLLRKLAAGEQIIVLTFVKYYV